MYVCDISMLSPTSCAIEGMNADFSRTMFANARGHALVRVRGAGDQLGAQSQRGA